VIRKATRADVLRFVQLGQEFWYESDAHLTFGEYNPIHVQRSLDQGFSNQTLLGWASSDGAGSTPSSGIVVNNTTSLWNGNKILKEMAWFCPKEKRGSLECIRLYKQVEEFAIKNNYYQIIMSRIKGVPSYAKLGDFYERQGFYHLEDDYVKSLK